MDPDWQVRLHQANGVRGVSLSPLCNGASSAPLSEEAAAPLVPLPSGQIMAGQPLALRVAFADDERARQFCERKRIRAPGNEKETARAMGRLMRAGFSSTAIWKVLRGWRVAVDETEIEGSAGEE